MITGRVDLPEVDAVPLAEAAGETFDPFRLPTPVPWFPKRNGE